MGYLRLKLGALIAGARGSSAISIGSHIDTTGEASVAIAVSEKWRRVNFRLSPDGARRIASQMTEWADAADKRNEENATHKTTMQWRYVTQAIINGVEGEKTNQEAAPVAQST